MNLGKRERQERQNMHDNQGTGARLTNGLVFSKQLILCNKILEFRVESPDPESPMINDVITRAFQNEETDALVRAFWKSPQCHSESHPEGEMRPIDQ